MSEKENPFDEVEDTVEVAQEVEAEDEEDEGPDDIEIAFDEAMSEGKTEDEIMLAMIEAGATFKNVKTRFNALMVDNGYLNSRAEKQEIVNKCLEGADLSTEESFNSAIAALVAELKGVNEKSAAASIRQYAKKNELECYKKPKGEGAGRTGITSQMHDFIVANLPISDEALIAWIDENGTQNTKRHEKVYLAQAHMANRAYRKASGQAEAA